MKRLSWTGIRKRDEGASALEFALVSLVLLLLLGGMLEFGFLFQAQLAVTHAAREGARLASVKDGALWDAGVVADRAYPLKTSDGLAVNRSPGVDSVTVEVTYPWSGLIMSFGDPVTLSGRATMRME